jgi:glutamine amidotransferase
MARSPQTVLVDYGMGNLHSVSKALEVTGHRVVVQRTPDLPPAATHLVLPGVGAFGEGMARLEKAGWIPVILDWVRSDRPFLGICLGMQLLFDESHEFGTHRGMGIFSGSILPFDPRLGKVPQIGWNEVRKSADHPIWAGIQDFPDLYFVHSYHARTEDRSIVLGETHYQITYPSLVGRSRVAGMQFHPEKSQEFGLSLLKNFGAF